MEKMLNEKFETIWKRICDNTEKRFYTKQGKTFTYKIENNCFYSDFCYGGCLLKPFENKC